MDDDELMYCRAIVLKTATDIARDRAAVSGVHPGADEIVGCARMLFDFVWSGK